MKLKKFLSLPILSVISLLGFVYYVTAFVFIEDLYGLQSSAGFLNFVIFSLLASLCASSFIICVLKDPGGVPSGYIPDVEENQEFKKSGLNQQQCDKCSARKPPRAHHCRICGRCILKMDHHCVWVNNCVGLRNYKAFLLLIFYATVACFYSAVIIVRCTFHKEWEYTSNQYLKVFYISCESITAGLCLTLGTLLGWHIYLVAHNMTTIEYYEAKRARWLARKSGLSYFHPYDVGVFRNVALVLGSDKVKWLWPTAVGHVKDGLSFPTSRDNNTL